MTTALVVLGVGFLAGCTAASPAPDGRDASDDWSMTRAPSTAGDATTEPEENMAGRACARQVRRAARRLYWPMRQANEAVLASPSGRSTSWAGRLHRRVAASWRGLDQSCVTPSSPAAQLRQLARLLAEDRLSLTGMRQVLRGYAALVREIGAGDDADSLLARHDRCRTRRGLVTAEYRPFWAWRGTGKAHWVQITFTNRTGRSVAGDMRGRVWVKGLRPPLRPEGIPELHDRERRAWALTWGGSSADSWVVPARSTESRLAPVYSAGGSHPSPFPTGRDGAIVGVTMSAEYYGRRGRLGCPVLIRGG